MCFPFRSKGRGSSRELKRSNSTRELACNDPRGSRYPGTRTDSSKEEEGLGDTFLKSSVAEILLEEHLTVQQAQECSLG